MMESTKTNQMDPLQPNLSRSEVHKLTPEQKEMRRKHLAKLKSKRHYYKNLKKQRQYSREKAKEYRSDPDKAARIKARKRAGYSGLTPEEIANIRNHQNNCCAICSDPDPSDLDHCHTTGQVRWLLCKHCNRGLGAFRDNPQLLEKAAKMLKEAKFQ